MQRHLLDFTASVQPRAHVGHPFLRKSNLPLDELAPRLVARGRRVEVPSILRELSRQLYVSFCLKRLSLVPGSGHGAQDSGHVTKINPTSRSIIPLARNPWKSSSNSKSTTSETGRSRNEGASRPTSSGPWTARAAGASILIPVPATSLVSRRPSEALRTEA